MKTRHLPNLLFAALALALAATAAAQSETPLPTSDDVKALVAAGKFKDALPPLTRLLALKGNAAIGYDRYELLMLKAECELQIHQQPALLDLLAQARKEAFAENRPDRAEAPIALTLLVKHSQAYHYKSKSAPHDKPISILDRTLRPAAYAALLADELPAVKKKVPALNNVKTIEPVMEMAREVGGMRALEIMSKPDVPESSLDTTPLVGDVSTNADRLLSTAIDSMAKNLAVISAAANQIVTVQVQNYDPVSRKAWLTPQKQRRGLSTQDAHNLSAIENTCDRIHSAAADMAMDLAADIDVYKKIAGNADALRQKAAAVLGDNYTVIP